MKALIVASFILLFAIGFASATFGKDTAALPGNCQINDLTTGYAKGREANCETDLPGFLTWFDTTDEPIPAVVNSVCELGENLTIIKCVHTCTPDDNSDCSDFAAACANSDLSCTGGVCTCTVDNSD